MTQRTIQNIKKYIKEMINECLDRSRQDLESVFLSPNFINVIVKHEDLIKA